MLRHDSGEGKRSGQISVPVEFGKELFRFTCELDLLHSTESPEVVNLFDWKSGWKRWTFGTVADSFQFQFYAWLVLENYPEINAVDVRVVRTADNYVTKPWRAERRRMRDWRARAMSALAEYGRPNNEAWPSPDKCAWCPVIEHCNLAAPEVALVAESPGAAVDWLVQIEAHTDQVKKTLGAIVEKTGDIQGAQSKVWFGRDKPSTRKKPLATYKRD